ncbi:MAG: 4-(cytidine 5'-diphospho)-2-C-methyl-D-erythritol kinase [Planctomycetaceae bacterium]
MSCWTACQPGAKRAADGELVVSSSSKLNLFLEVLAKRDDGFHELETVMVRTSFCDTLRLRVRADSRCTLRLSDTTASGFAKTVPLDETNLIIRAARTLQQLTGCRNGVDIVLHKTIPPQAGLGGGSGNAAATLLALRSLWEQSVSDRELHDMAAQLGSDVNFLLSDCRAAVCRGRGEEIHPVAIRGNWYFLAVRPSLGNATAEVFSRCQIPERPRSSLKLTEHLQNGRVAAAQQYFFNRLTSGAVSCNPEMQRMMHKIAQKPRRVVWMSGSGSTLFVAAMSFVEAQQIRTDLQQLLRRDVWLLRV